MSQQQNPNVSVDKQVRQERERTPVSAQRDKFKFRNLRPAKFYYRLIDISKPDNVARFMEAGYTWVREDGNTKAMSGPDVSTEEPGSFITVRGGGGKTLGLVCLPLEIWQADQKAKQDAILESERAMKQNLASMADPRSGNYGGVDWSDSKPAKRTV